MDTTPACGDDGIEPRPFEPGDVVRFRNDPDRVGIVTEIYPTDPNRCSLRLVQTNQVKRNVRVDQLVLVPKAQEDPADMLEAGQLSDPSSLRRLISHIRLTGRLSDMLYSMEVSDTDFYAHQFKPVLKMLASPTGALLIADEVGLGKTIEAGLIWAELKARFDLNRLLVVCPKVLNEKWRSELRERFDVDAHVVTPKDLLSDIGDESRRRGFAAICGFQSLRPNAGWDAESSGRPSNAFARLLDERAEDEPLFDLVIVDEAHHMRNDDTKSHELVRLLQPTTQHLLFLSATPIHLGNENLYALLKLVDPATFRDQTVLNEIVQANEPLIRAREAILKHASKEEVLEIASDARHHKLLKGNRQLDQLMTELGEVSRLTNDSRAAFASRFEQVNLLANLVNRTRRRDVEEFRVRREVGQYPATMNEREREIYDRVTVSIQNFALINDVPQGFLLSTPQRLLCSSIPAALRHWGVGDSIGGSLSDDDESEVEDKPINNAIRSALNPLDDLLEVVSNDTKFVELKHALETFFRQNPEEKVIVFSTFRPTIAYLAERLDEVGFPCIQMHGDTRDRAATVRYFRDDPETRVLLSSEVGSEGIDLQFCRTVINYDLPWNPMKVEQRIGRVDRLGQKSEFVRVINLYYRHSIDEQIYGRLYTRLEICERALGGFESVLGKEIETITGLLLKGALDDTEIEDRLEQTAMAIENKRKEEDSLEKHAGSLIAHGDHILQSIHSARDMHRWLSAEDLADYVEDGLRQFYPGSQVQGPDKAGNWTIKLSDEARSQFSRFLKDHKLPRGQLTEGSGGVKCRFGRPDRDVKETANAETVGQTHPLLRFLSGKKSQTEEVGVRPAIAIALDTSTLPKNHRLPPGYYLVGVEFWRFGGAYDEQKIAYAALDLQNGEFIEDQAAESLTQVAAANGRLWPNARLEVDLENAADLCKSKLFTRLDDRFGNEEAEKRASLEDRADIQLQTLERRHATAKERVEATLANQRYRHSLGGKAARKTEAIIRMNEGKLRKIDRNLEEGRKTIEENKKLDPESERLAVVLVSVK
jgi:SNF2 family DNA or RNA helicase